MAAPGYGQAAPDAYNQANYQSNMQQQGYGAQGYGAYGAYPGYGQPDASGAYAAQAAYGAYGADYYQTATANYQGWGVPPAPAAGAQGTAAAGTQQPGANQAAPQQPQAQQYWTQQQQQGTWPTGATGQNGVNLDE